MRKHYVMFYSPGTFVAETTVQEIQSWNVNEAVKMSKSITERYDAKPYGFRFMTKARTNKELDSKVVDSSKMYFLGGTIETYEEIVKRNDPSEEILRNNMKCNGFDKIVITCTPWKWIQPLHDGDIVLDMSRYEKE